MHRQLHVIIACCLFITPSAFGWGREDHRIVGDIASKHLNDNAKAAIKDLLGGKTLADVSTWADEIRRDPRYRWASRLHYVNLPEGAKEFKFDRDCPDWKCVVGAILDYSDKLKHSDTPRDKRIEALKFLVHFVGDIHQPLHVSHARDKGGNDIHVEFFNQPTNLHKLWDTMIIRRRTRKWSELAKTLNERITPEQIKKWSTTDPVVWANESYKLAVSNAYKIPRDGQLGKEYYEKNVKVVEKQLQKAGIRLAAMLNSIFPDDGKTSPKHDEKDRQKAHTGSES